MSTLVCDGATLWFEVVGDGELLVTLHGGLGLEHTVLTGLSLWTRGDPPRHDGSFSHLPQGSSPEGTTGR